LRAKGSSETTDAGSGKGVNLRFPA
jgi:hypothetical protein